MLDAFIIEEIKRREEARQDRNRPQPSVPTAEEDEGPRRRSETEDDGSQRGVIVIDLAVRDSAGNTSPGLPNFAR
jgi:hypothetical protein